MKKILFIIILSTVLLISIVTVTAISYINRDVSTSFIEPNKRRLPNEEQVNKIFVGMEFQEVVDILGKPQRDIGSGVIIYEFDLSNGNILRTFWKNDVEKENEYMNEHPDMKSYGCHFLMLTNFEIVDGKK